MEINKNLSQILVVDDDIHQTNMICDLLTSKGYCASVAFSSKEAEFMLRRQPFNVALIDCLMPGMDGYTLAKKIYEQFGMSISVILMSGIFKESSVDVDQTPNMHTLLQKPIHEQVLDVELINILRKMYYTKFDSHIYSLISQSVVPTKEIQQQISNLKTIHEGEALLLFSYLFHSKSEGVLCLSDGDISVEIFFFNGFIVQFKDSKEKLEIINYISKHSLLSKAEMEFIAKSEDTHLEYLIEQGFMSPHQLTAYNIERILFCLTHFAKKRDVEVQFKPLAGDFISNTVQTDIISRKKIRLSNLSNTLVSFISNEMSDSYLKTCFDHISGEKLNLQALLEAPPESYSTPVLKPIFKNRDVFKSLCSLEDLYKKFKNTDQFKRALFTAMFHGLIKIRNNSVEKNLETLYSYRYSKMLELMKDMTVFEVFEYLGCTCTSDPQKLKSVYQNFIRFNHSDKFSCFGSSLYQLVQKVNQIVIQAYDILSDTGNRTQYTQKLKSKESKKFIEYDVLQEKLKDFYLMKQFDQAFKILDEIDIMFPGVSEIKSEISLWKIILDMKKDNFELSEVLKMNISSLLSKADMYDHCIYLFHYAAGLFYICKNDFNTAQECFDKSLEHNSAFHLAKIESVSLNKLERKMGKNQYSILKTLKFKKSS